MSMQVALLEQLALVSHSLTSREQVLPYQPAEHSHLHKTSMQWKFYTIRITPKFPKRLAVENLLNYKEISVITIYSNAIASSNSPKVIEEINTSSSILTGIVNTFIDLYITQTTFPACTAFTTISKDIVFACGIITALICCNQ